jgi:hypothetical protein
MTAAMAIERRQQNLDADDIRWDTVEWPGVLQGLHDTIVQSRSLLDWSADWDGEGAPGYAEATWTCAADLLTRLAIPAYHTFGIVLPAPAMLAGPAGGVDLHWTLPRRELLINISAMCARIAYYGDNGAGSDSVEGQLDQDTDHLWIAVWLTHP